MVSTKFHLICGHRPVIGVGALIGDDKQKANQALAVQLRQLRFDGVDPIQELRLHITWLGRNSFTTSMDSQGFVAHVNHAGARKERSRRFALCCAIVRSN